MNAIGSLDQNTQSHVYHPNYHGNLHFERIDVVKVIGSDGPNWIQPKGIHAAGLLRDGVAWLHLLGLVAGAKEVQTDGKVVVVDETAVGSEETHQSYHVAVRPQHFEC